MIPRQYRLSLRFQRKNLDLRGKVEHSSLYTKVTFSNNLPNSRFAILISKKVSPKSTQRHYLKRLLFASIYQNIQKIPQSVDYLIIPKKALNALSHQQISKTMVEFLTKSN